MADVEVDDRSSWGGDPQPLVDQAVFLIGELRLHPATELSLSLVDPDEMAELHVEWMGLAGPTDVLSFPMDELCVPASGEEPVPGMLGDIVLCPQVAADQGETAGHGQTAELELLLTHGVLHLLGHDHAEPDEHAVMFALQDELLAAWRAKGR